MNTTVDIVNVREHHALFRLSSSSPTVYYIDSRGQGVSVLRALGCGDTSPGLFDNQWVALWSLVSGPRLVDGDRELTEAEVDTDDKRPWVLRVGSRHYFHSRAPGVLGLDDDERAGRVVERIEVLNEMPPRELWLHVPGEGGISDGRRA